MGNPPDSDFVAGDQCVAFETLFGETSTPAKVKATLVGITKCPLYPNPPKNGSFILTQTGSPCIWQGIENFQEILWSLLGGGSMQVIDTAFPLGVFFLAVGQTDFYNNTQTCPGVGTGGTVKITWGPEIPKL
ncbi:hypothetical protein LCGC14_1609230 [marine sediment metagenome]|uniref:Uncharacterized protein n=1 Tax=marine sediment metagenome TaxID=412755 RepID=A0A0F9IVJ2_9ZZZZ